MSLQSNPLFEIRKSAFKNRDGIHYDLFPKDANEITGSADLFFATVDSCRRDTRYEPLINGGLKNTDKIANLAYFDPYEAYTPKPKNVSDSQKRSAASEELLNVIITESSKNGCKAIITLTGMPEMKAFLSKNKFISTDQNEQEYYKILISGSI